MKYKSKKSIIVKLCLLAMILCICSGCGKNSSSDDEKEDTKVSTEESKKEEPSVEASKPDESGEEAKEDTQEQTPSTEEMQPSEETQPSDETEPSEETQLTEGIVEVDSVEDFLEAIQPGATIKMKPGYYNLSDYIERIWSEQGDEWNEKHPYVELYKCWDGGIEVAIQDVQDLSVFADLEGAVVTELVVETRAGSVLNFEDCNNIFLHGLTMGHTQDGACDSSVISFRNTSNVYLTAMDLYGCGMYGLDAMYGSGNIYVQSCTIRDCEDGPFYIMDSQGKYEFRNCWLSGSNGGGYYEPADDAELSFVECNFGEMETNYWYYDESATFTDCYWEEITEYPDVEPEGEDVLDIDSLIPTDANEWNLADTYYAYMFVNQQSGETEYYPSFTLELYEDGSGWCETEDEYFEFTWYCESDGTITLESEIYHYLTPYVEHMDGFDRLWFMMQMNETVIWIY